MHDWHYCFQGVCFLWVCPILKLSSSSLHLQHLFYQYWVQLLSLHSKITRNKEWMKWIICWTADMKSSEAMILTVVNVILQLHREAWKCQDFNRVCTCDLVMLVWRSNWLSYEATYVGSWSFCGFIMFPARIIDSLDFICTVQYLIHFRRKKEINHYWEGEKVRFSAVNPNPFWNPNLEIRHEVLGYTAIGKV